MLVSRGALVMPTSSGSNALLTGDLLSKLTYLIEQNPSLISGWSQ